MYQKLLLIMGQKTGGQICQKLSFIFLVGIIKPYSFKHKTHFYCFVYVYMCAWVDIHHLCCVICPGTPEEGTRSLEAWLQVAVGPSLNSDLLPEQPELLTTEPSAPALNFFSYFQWLEMETGLQQELLQCYASPFQQHNANLFNYF